MNFFKRLLLGRAHGSVRVVSPLLLVLERCGLVQPKLIAAVDVGANWPAGIDEDTEAGYEEEVTYYLLEWPSGRREYDWHAYGKADECDFYEVYLRDIILWTHGGPLPPGAIRPKAQTAEIVPFRVVATNPPVVEEP